MRLLLCVAAAVGAAQMAEAQTGAMAADVRWQPAQPAQGTLIYLIVNPHSASTELGVTGSVAGQQLHFEEDSSGEFRALAPIPVNAMETIPFSFAVIERADTSHRMIRIPVRPTEYRSSRLSVDPRFTEAPDAALQARIRSESAQSAEVSRRSHTTPTLWRGEWIRPRPSPITSEFGVQRMFNGELRSRHTGVDFDGETGDPIFAANRGVVSLVGSFYYAGNVVYVDHGRGLITIYMHMTEVLVEEGQLVETGEQIGRVGATGRVTGPHVPWTARYGRVSVDGMSLFELDIRRDNTVAESGN